MKKLLTWNEVLELVTWNEVLELDLENMGKVAAEIERTSDPVRLARLESRLANLNTHYREHRQAMEDGLACSYFRTTMSEAK